MARGGKAPALHGHQLTLALSSNPTSSGSVITRVLVAATLARNCALSANRQLEGPSTRRGRPSTELSLPTTASCGRTDPAAPGHQPVAEDIPMASMGLISIGNLQAAGLGLTIAAFYVFRQVVAWFSRLDAQSSSKTVQTLEDPSQIAPVASPSLFSEPSKSLTIVVPAYNEEDRLPAALDEAITYLETRKKTQGAYFTYEILIVDDGSKDSTASKVFDYIRRYGFDTIRLLRLTMNCGKGAAVKQGMLCARGCSILMMDADGATRVADLDKLEEKLKNMRAKDSKKAAVVYGSRAHLQSQSCAKRSWYRNILMHGFHTLVLLVAGPLCPKDTQCGFKLFNRPAAQLLFPNQRLQRWCFDVELTWLAFSLKVPIEEVGVNWTEIPGSKIRITSIIHMALELAGVQIAYKWLKLWNVRTQTEILKMSE